MCWRASGSSLLRVALMVAVLVAATSIPASAAEQAAVILDFELVGAACAQTSVVVSASSCDGQTIANSLVAKLTAEGFTNILCGYSVNEMWECLYIIPSGCSLEDSTITLKAGRSCQVGVTEGWTSFTTSTIGTFAFNIQ